MIQTLNNLPDEQLECLINDRLSFNYFLSKRIGCLMQAGAIKMLFNRLDAILRNAAYLPIPAPILDAHWWGPSNSATPTGEEEDFHAERIPETWKDKPQKRSHKGRLTRWTLKFMTANQQNMREFLRQNSPSHSSTINRISSLFGNSGQFEKESNKCCRQR